MSNLKVLHITSWYPSVELPKEALWIERHINALSSYSENEVYHFEIKKSTVFRVSRRETYNLHQAIIHTPWHSWFVIEYLHFFWLLYQLIGKRVHKKFDVINFHIAYPMLTYWWLLKPFINKPVIITEHWSAYHFHFGIKGSKKLLPIKRIFIHAHKIIVVSKALQNDIEQFTDELKLPFVVIPNTVDTSVFYYQKCEINAARFFMVSNWKTPKKPIVILEAFKRVLIDFPSAILRIGGYGPLEDEIKAAISQMNLETSAIFLGKLSSAEIAEEMRQATAFIHSSDYETFSVVCAESICCGCPVIAPQVGGIVEFINQTNGFLYKSEDEIALLMVQSVTSKFDRLLVAESGRKFSSREVGGSYYKTLIDVVG